MNGTAFPFVIIIPDYFQYFIPGKYNSLVFHQIRKKFKFFIGQDDLFAADRTFTLSPLRIILVGVAVNSMFAGLSSAFNSMNGGNMSGVAAIVNGNITMKTWDDVHTLVWYVAAGLILSMVFSGKCNLLSLEDKTA
ncbi:iron chelate uptake ABC transporter family permease subunit, partial [Clostridioides difficile]|uniref:iron chelate uptake ABC transporter family permease subunit n=1 Tax=Clostridioides difficile TaxID=1496 RepID=UPI0023585F95